ncbi:MAG: type 4a pilus biogenesis protein PilO [Spirochaetia bacterium]|nr:type 4a pilus biogenesis protein PilO [Spirochaetia bacterium]
MMAEPPKKPGQPAPAAPAGKPGALKFNIQLTQKQQQNLIAGVLIVALVGFGYAKLLVLPDMQKIKDKTVVLDQKKKDLSDARKLVSEYDQFLKKASDISARTDFVDRRIPQQTNIADTIKEMTSKATESNISIIRFEPGKEVTKGDYKEMDVAVAFSSTYNDLGNFLTAIGYIERLTTPFNLSIRQKPYSAGQKVISRENIDVNMNVKIYSLM